MSRRSYMLLGVGPRSSKTAVTVSMCRALSNTGWQVSPYKAVTVVDGNQFCIHRQADLGLGLKHHCRAARIPFDLSMNPIIAIKSDLGTCNILVEGKYVGEVPMLNEDTPLLRCLNLDAQEKIWDSVRESIKAVLQSHEITIIEGASSPFDLPEEEDIANILVARLARPSIYFSSLFSGGGSVAALIGSGICLPPDLRSLLRGFILSDVRCGATVSRLIERIEEQLGVPCVGAIPHIAMNWAKNGENSEDDEMAYETWASAISHTLDLDMTKD